MIGRARAAGRVRVIAVNDAVYPLWFADMVYAADASWWNEHAGLPGFRGERWSSHGNAQHNDKRQSAERFGLYLIKGVDGEGFSLDPSLIHYGENSGLQAMNIAGHAIGWCGLIIGIGFDMRMVNGRRHFFGEHPQGLRATQQGYGRWPAFFAKAAEGLPKDTRIVNCTPGSSLTCFETMDLRQALELSA